MKWWPTACRRGDMVRVNVSGVWHYGVYVSDDKVIQFGYPPRRGAESAENIRVVSTTADEFAGRDILEVAQLSLFERLKRQSPDRTVQAAESSLGEGGYDLINNNCEHFAYRCVFGKARSAQAEDALSHSAIATQVWLSRVPERVSRGDIDGLQPAARREYILSAGENTRLPAQRAQDWLTLKSLVKAASGLDLYRLNARQLDGGKWVADGIEFSLSHTDRYVAVAVSAAPVGVDIEEKTDARLAAISKIGGRILAPGESASDAEELLAMWTRKESLFKMKGEGGFDPKSVPSDSTLTRSYLTEDGVILSVSCIRPPENIRLWDGERLKEVKYAELTPKRGAGA